MSRRFDVFGDRITEDEDKAYVRFSYSNCGKDVKFNGEYDYDVTWPEILSDVVKTLEGSFGYKFDLLAHEDELGIYAPQKDSVDAD